MLRRVVGNKVCALLKNACNAYIYVYNEADSFAEIGPHLVSFAEATRLTGILQTPPNTPLAVLTAPQDTRTNRHGNHAEDNAAFHPSAVPQEGPIPPIESMGLPMLLPWRQITASEHG